MGEAMRELKLLEKFPGTLFSIRKTSGQGRGKDVVENTQVGNKVELLKKKTNMTGTEGGAVGCRKGVRIMATNQKVSGCGSQEPAGDKQQG